MTKEHWTWLVAGVVVGAVWAYLRPGTGRFGK